MPYLVKAQAFMISHCRLDHDSVWEYANNAFTDNMFVTMSPDCQATQDWVTH